MGCYYCQKLASRISDGRLTGLIDWDAIIDRTRNLQSNNHWNSPAEIIEIAANTYQIDKWDNQPNRVEVWIEKDALIGVIENICSRLDVSYFSCRGYTSQSEMWSAAMRLKQYCEAGQDVTILHLGDHDPSGIDMSRNIEERLNMFMHPYCINFDRLALNYDQLKKYNPPPNPAKFTDPRAKDYVAEYGRKSWELDALNPKVMEDLIKDNVVALRDEKLWLKAMKAERKDVRKLTKISEEF